MSDFVGFDEQHAIPVDDEEDDDCIRELSDEERDALLVRMQQTTSARTGPPSLATSVNSRGVTVKAELCVELEDHDFFYVRGVSRTYPITMEGHLLRRTRRVKNMFPKVCNEVAVVFQALDGQDDPQLHECLTSIPIERAIASRNVIFTNRTFPEMSCHAGKGYSASLDIQQNEVLVCRWKHIEYVQLQMGNRLRPAKVISEAVIGISQKESSPGAGVPDMVRWNAWRGTSAASFPTRKLKRKNDADRDDCMIIDESEFKCGTKGEKNKSRQVDVDLTMDDSGGEATTKRAYQPPRLDIDNRARSLNTVYTYADICAGGGGAALGAKQAGLERVFLLDIGKDACKTLQANNPSVQILCNDLYQLAVGTIPGFRAPYVDIVHISFPCQTHSSAHTVNGRDDDKNEAACLSLLQLLDRLKPRVLTMGTYRLASAFLECVLMSTAEQTSGMRTHGGRLFMNALLHMLISKGYSCRATVLNCAEYNYVQARKRLFFIASW